VNKFSRKQTARELYALAEAVRRLDPSSIKIGPERALLVRENIAARLDRIAATVSGRKNPAGRITGGACAETNRQMRAKKMYQKTRVNTSDI